MISLEALRAAEHLSVLDVHFAHTVTRLGGEACPEVVLAAALVSRAVAQSHVCLDLRALTSDPVLRAADGTVLSEQAWPELASWTEQLRRSPLVGAENDVTPLVLDQSQRLYLRRYWQHETHVAEALQRRALQRDTQLEPGWLKTTLERLFADSQHSGASDGQRLAALLAARRHLSIITGGPGTGKTYTVVKILALLIELAQQRQQPLPRITLLAPTGKAAARLSEAIRKAKQVLNASEAVKAAIPEETATIHRSLKPLHGSATAFRHNAGNPLVSDIVLVDEASMIDVGLMARLLAAVPSAARLILLGDQDQLASVEAGAVLGDLCNSGSAPGYSEELRRDIAEITGRTDFPVSSRERPGIWDCIAYLTHSYRYGQRSGIGALARALNRGDADAALQILADDAYSDVARLDPPAGWEISAALQTDVVRGFEPYLRAGDAIAQLRAFEQFRVLCAHRRGVGGVQTLNAQIEAVLTQAGLIAPTAAAYLGRPIMVTENDYQVHLFNGDIGVVVHDDQFGETRMVAFEGENGQLRLLAPSRLPAHETTFAMSIHKSQGSEFDDVAVVLPERLSPVLTRELLYTAVTRARRRVTLYATPEILRAAIGRRVQRASGLRQRLWGESAN